MTQKTEGWGSRVGLILAMAGNAVGLGNFLRFPVEAVKNGGGAFMIPYLICFFLIGIPLLWVEWTIGRFGGLLGEHSTPYIVHKMGKKKAWKYIGSFGIFINIVIAAYYCYIEAWTISYVFHSLGQTFSGLSSTQVAQFFDRYVAIGYSTSGIPFESVIAYILCLALNTYILSKDMSKGIERVAKIGMPLLIIFGAFLAFQGITLGDTGRCATCNSTVGLNFLWNPQFSSLLDLNVWLAAAGQIFFTLSVGMGTIQCYASFVKKNDDIALNAMSAGWMNSFVEVVLGASIVIPIAVGYLGLGWVQDNAGFSMAFQTMPYLFGQWGDAIGTIMGVFWFGLLFFAAITSSLAMGTPWVNFMKDGFNFNKRKAAWSFGLITLIIGLPTVFFYNNGVFSEYDFWSGTVGLVGLATIEVILFSWIFGINNSWNHLKQGADIKVSNIVKYIALIITPTLLILIFIGSAIKPKNNDWHKAITEGWEFDEGSIIGKLNHAGIKYNHSYFSNKYYATTTGFISRIDTGKAYYRIYQRIPQTKEANFSDIRVKEGETVPSGTIIGLTHLPNGKIDTFKLEKEAYIYHINRRNNKTEIKYSTEEKVYKKRKNKNVLVKKGNYVKAGTAIFSGHFVNNIFYIDMGRFLLILLFLFLLYLVYRSSKIRQKLNS